MANADGHHEEEEVHAEGQLQREDVMRLSWLSMMGMAGFYYDTHLPVIDTYTANIYTAIYISHTSNR